MYFFKRCKDDINARLTNGHKILVNSRYQYKKQELSTFKSIANSFKIVGLLEEKKIYIITIEDMSGRTG